MGIVNVLSGEYLEFNKDNITNEENLQHALYASFSWPGIFPPANAFGSKWFDGSAVYNLDTFSAINKCLSEGYA